ncbi:hypothetical protein IFM61392_06936 [Aspergillus lentulus]|nr:hypothetical protein IFM61392_06936 [Aspergillus lentulus]
MLRTLGDQSDRYLRNCFAVEETPALTSWTAPMIALKIRQSLEQLSGDEFHIRYRWLQEAQAFNGLLDMAPAFDADTLYVNNWAKSPFQQVSFSFESARFWQPLEVETLPVKNLAGC